MQFVIKLFPEITIKSKPVRKKMIQRLQNNLANLMRSISDQIKIVKDWDKLTVEVLVDDPVVLAQVRETLSNTPGITYFLEVDTTEFETLDDICLATAAHYMPLLAGKRFVVRCKRAGSHDWKSHDIERYVGGYLNQNSEAVGVDLHTPDVTVSIEVRHNQVYVVKDRVEGLGGFPMGEVEPVLSLISGGFDSPVASYLCMKRGMPTHFVFFNLGGRDHELGVKEVAYYLWSKYSASRRVQFISVPFEGVVSEILQNVENSQMGVILKRMMYRAADAVADKLDVQALVTGEAVAQVSSQTLTNLSIIDAVTERLVLRPLVAADKDDIVRTARKIGTEEFAANMPEYCGVISVKPTTKARMYRIEHQEEKFNFDVLDQAIEQADFINIDQLGDLDKTKVEVESFDFPVAESIIVDIRHPDEQEMKPLSVTSNEVELIPFYSLHNSVLKFDKKKKYLLYCEKGVMSKLHASHLVEDGLNVGVYRPKA